MGMGKMDEKDIKGKKDKKNKKDKTDKINKQYLCIKQELLLRLADKEKIGKKRWFYSPEEIQKLENFEKEKKKNKN